TDRKHAPTGLSEVGRKDETVMAGADHDAVVGAQLGVPSLHIGFRGREAVTLHLPLRKGRSARLRAGWGSRFPPDCFAVDLPFQGEVRGSAARWARSNTTK